MDGEGITCTETLLELAVSPSSASTVYIHVHVHYIITKQKCVVLCKEITVCYIIHFIHSSKV